MAIELCKRRVVVATLCPECLAQPRASLTLPNSVHFVQLPNADTNYPLVDPTHGVWGWRGVGGRLVSGDGGREWEQRGRLHGVATKAIPERHPTTTPHSILPIYAYPPPLPITRDLDY